MRKWMSASITTLVIGSVTTVGSAAVNACGESLFPVGKGVIFRNYATPLPGRILIVARTPGELQMAERLRAAGHDIQVVSAPDQIGAALGNADVDIVMSLFKERQVAAQQISDAGSHATYLPVAQHNTPEVKAAQAAVRRSLSTGDDVKTFLRVIHRTLKDQKA
jgi:hypothetical protein